VITPEIMSLGTDAVQFAFWAAVSFVIGYTLLASWWKKPLGWARISLDAGIALALSTTLFHLWFGVRVENSLFFAWYQISTVFLVGVISLWNLALVAYYQLKELRKQQ
jgi:hypothetical protein